MAGWKTFLSSQVQKKVFNGATSELDTCPSRQKSESYLKSRKEESQDYFHFCREAWEDVTTKEGLSQPRRLHVSHKPRNHVSASMLLHLAQLESSSKKKSFLIPLSAICAVIIRKDDDGEAEGSRTRPVRSAQQKGNLQAKVSNPLKTRGVDMPTKWLIECQYAEEQLGVIEPQHPS